MRRMWGNLFFVLVIWVWSIFVDQMCVIPSCTVLTIDQLRWRGNQKDGRQRVEEQKVATLLTYWLDFFDSKSESDFIHLENHPPWNGHVEGVPQPYLTGMIFQVDHISDWGLQDITGANFSCASWVKIEFNSKIMVFTFELTNSQCVKAVFTY